MMECLPFMKGYLLKPSWRVWSRILTFNQTLSLSVSVSLSVCSIFEFCPRNSLCCIDLLIQETELICMCKLAVRTFPFTGLYGWWTVYLISFFRALSLTFRAKDVISALVTWRTYLCELNDVMSPEGFQAGCFLLLEYSTSPLLEALEKLMCHLHFHKEKDFFCHLLFYFPRIISYA